VIYDQHTLINIFVVSFRVCQLFVFVFIVKWSDGTCYVLLAEIFFVVEQNKLFDRQLCFCLLDFNLVEHV